MTPIIMLVGGAGSGKDTVAEMLATELPDTQAIAQADPMKRFAKEVFGFTEDQLWGPSSSRNAVDHRYDFLTGWDQAQEILIKDNSFIPKFLWNSLGIIESEGVEDALATWFLDLREKYSKVGGLTPRIVLQTLGTEFGRALDQNIWSNQALGVAWELLSGISGYSRDRGLISAHGAAKNLVIITDGRFRNEVLAVKRVGGVVIKIQNPQDAEDRQKVQAAGVAGHASETQLQGIPDSWFDTILVNDKTKGLENLRELVSAMAADIMAGRSPGDPAGFFQNRALAATLK